MLKKVAVLVFTIFLALAIPAAAAETDSINVDEEFISGELIYLEISDEIYVDEAAQIIAIFENTGQIAVPVQLKVDVYFEDQILNTIESDTGTVSPGKQVKFENYFIVEQSGTYVIKSYIIYADQQSNVKEVTINVKNKEMPLGFGALPILFLVVALVVLWHFAKYPVKGKRKPKLFRRSKRRSFSL